MIFAAWYGKEKFPPPRAKYSNSASELNRRILIWSCIFCLFSAFISMLVVPGKGEIDNRCWRHNNGDILSFMLHKARPLQHNSWSRYPYKSFVSCASENTIYKRPTRQNIINSGSYNDVRSWETMSPTKKGTRKKKQSKAWKGIGIPVTFSGGKHRGPSSWDTPVHLRTSPPPTPPPQPSFSPLPLLHCRPTFWCGCVGPFTQIHLLKQVCVSSSPKVLHHHSGSNGMTKAPGLLLIFPPDFSSSPQAYAISDIGYCALFLLTEVTLRNATQWWWRVCFIFTEEIMRGRTWT